MVFLGTGDPTDLSPRGQQLVREASGLVAWIEPPQALAERAIERLSTPSRDQWAVRLRARADDAFTYLAPGFGPDDDPGVEIVRGVLADAGVDVELVPSSDLNLSGPAVVGPASRSWRPDPALATFVRGIRDREELDAWRATIEGEFGPDVRLLMREWTSKMWRHAVDRPRAYPVTLHAEPTDASRQRSAARLREVFEVLRGPDGCPWDRAQTHDSLRRFILEEAAEVVDAIDGGDAGELAAELGDVLANIALHAEIARQAGSFSWPDIVQAITAKMVRRHPHVFGDQTAQDASEVLTIWREAKAAEGHRTAHTTTDSALPALTQVAKLAGSAGVSEASAQTSDTTRSELSRTQTEDLAGDETRLGDALLGMALAAKQSGIDPELALRGAIRRAHARRKPAADMEQYVNA